MIRCRLDRRLKQEVKSINERRVYVSKLNLDTTSQDLTTHFETVGLVTKCEIKTTRRGSRKQNSLGAGWVEYMDPGWYDSIAYIFYNIKMRRLKFSIA